MAFYRFSIDSPLSVEAATEKVRSITRPPFKFVESIRSAFGKGPTISHLFMGEVTSNKFSIYRIIRYRNSFLPRIHGKICEKESGCRVCVAMTLHPLNACFMLFWLSAVGFGAWRMFEKVNDGRGVMVFAPFWMFVFGLALIAIGFFPEAFKAKRILEVALRSKENEPS